MGLNAVADSTGSNIHLIVGVDNGADLRIQRSGIGGHDAHVTAHNLNIVQLAAQGAVFIQLETLGTNANEHILVLHAGDLQHGILTDVNLAAGNGHPAEIMDMSFALQARGVLYMAKRGRDLEPGVYAVPTEIDRSVAWEKLASMNVQIDKLTPEQEEYMAGTGD